jgi:hypothetical protein
MHPGYGEGGRDFMLEDRLPDGLPVGKVAIVTNPPYGKNLHLLVAHAMELLRPVGGMLVVLVNVQWMAQKKNSILCCDPAFAAMVVLTDRLAPFKGPDGKPLKSPQENHVWLVWDFSPDRGPFQCLFVGKNLESEQRVCLGCGTPLPPGSRSDRRHCSDTCRQRVRRSGMAQHRDADSTAVMESRKAPVAGKRGSPAPAALG